jgi:flagellar motor switch protein FliM
MLHIVLWPATVMSSLAPTAPAPGSERVTPLSRALERQVVRLDALAGEAEIAFQELATLAPGDVLRLDRRLSEPVEVRVQNGGPVCSARLGTSRGRLALQLT